MNYSQIRKMDISNGCGIGVSLFVSGCDMNPKCPGCFNSVAWDFNAGKPFTKEVRDYFLNLANKPYVDRVTILGGEPFATKNYPDVLTLVKCLRDKFGESKKIWVYSGYTFEEIAKSEKQSILYSIDVLVDGRFVEQQKDLTLPFRGSLNQRIIDIKKTLCKGTMVLEKIE